MDSSRPVTGPHLLGTGSEEEPGVRPSLGVLRGPLPVPPCAGLCPSEGTWRHNASEIGFLNDFSQNIFYFFC